ncbi:MAG: hypothetical protein AAGC77_05400 [Pseudomonadota bacterium]
MARKFGNSGGIVLPLVLFAIAGFLSGQVASLQHALNLEAQAAHAAQYGGYKLSAAVEPEDGHEHHDHDHECHDHEDPDHDAHDHSCHEGDDHTQHDHEHEHEHSHNAADCSFCQFSHHNGAALGPIAGLSDDAQLGASWSASPNPGAFKPASVSLNRTRSPPA